MDALFEETAAESPLAEVVDGFWSRRAAPVSLEDVVIPDGCVDVIVVSAPSRRPEALLFGPTTRASRVTLLAGTEYHGVRFRPWVGGAPVGVEAGSLVDRVEALLSLSAAARAAFADRAPEEVLTELAGAWTAGHRWTAAQRLVREAYDSLAVDDAETVPRLARGLGVSERTLRRAFGEVTGRGPKMAARIHRMRRALQALRRGDPVIDVAYAHGFTDQAHLTHELHHLAGTTPAAVRRAVAGTYKPRRAAPR